MRTALTITLTTTLLTLTPTTPAEAVRRPTPICTTAIQQDRAYINKQPTTHPRRKKCITLRPLTWSTR